MRRTLLLLVAAVALAGCTQPVLERAEQERAVTGLVFDTARAAQPHVPSGGSTQLVVRLANTHPEPVTDVTVSVSNLGELGARLQQPTDQTGTTCTIDRIRAAGVGAPPTRTCVWRLDAPTVEVEQRYPVTVTADYTARLSMQDTSLHVTFTPDPIAESTTTTHTFENGELRLTTSHRRRHTAAPGTTEAVEVDLDITDIGPGRIPATDGERTVRFFPGGSMLDVLTLEQCGRNDTARFLGDRRSLSVTCAASEPSTDALPGQETSYTLRWTVEYPYRRHHEVPVTVFPR